MDEEKKTQYKEQCRLRNIKYRGREKGKKEPLTRKQRRALQENWRQAKRRQRQAPESRQEFNAKRRNEYQQKLPFC